MMSRERAVRLSPDKVERPIIEHAEPDRDQVAGLGFDRGCLGSEVLSWIGEGGGAPEASKDVNSLFERLHLLAGRALAEAKGSVCWLIHRPTTAEHEDEPTA